MSPLMARIDDRLIHQQVVDGCCRSLSARRLLLAHDQVAADEAERRVFAAAGPEGVATEVLSLKEAIARILQLQTSGELESTIVVTSTPADMLRLVEADCPIAEVTVGGMHPRADRPIEIWNGFFAGAAERDALLRLQDRGIHVVFQTVPGAPGRALRELAGPPGPE